LGDASLSPRPHHRSKKQNSLIDPWRWSRGAGVKRLAALRLQAGRVKN
jgi:hypothetical protein